MKLIKVITLIFIGALLSSCKDEYRDMPKRISKSENTHSLGKVNLSMSLRGVSKVGSTRFFDLGEKQENGQSFAAINYLPKDGCDIVLHGTLYGFVGSSNTLDIAIDFKTKATLKSQSSLLDIADDNITVERIRYVSNGNLVEKKDISDYNIKDNTQFFTLLYHNEILDDDFEDRLSFDDESREKGGTATDKFLLRNSLGATINTTYKVENGKKKPIYNVSMGLSAYDIHNTNTQGAHQTYFIPLISDKLIRTTAVIENGTTKRLKLKLDRKSDSKLIPRNSLIAYKITNNTSNPIKLEKLKAVSTTSPERLAGKTLPLYYSWSFLDYGKFYSRKIGENEGHPASIGLTPDEMPDYTTINGGLLNYNSGDLVTKNHIENMYGNMLEAWTNLSQATDSEKYKKVLFRQLKKGYNNDTDINNGSFVILSVDPNYTFKDQEIGVGETKVFYVKGHMNYNVLEFLNSPDKAPQWLLTEVNNSKLPYTAVHGTEGYIELQYSVPNDKYYKYSTTLIKASDGYPWFKTKSSVSINIDVRDKGVTPLRSLTEYNVIQLDPQMFNNNLTKSDYWFADYSNNPEATITDEDAFFNYKYDYSGAVLPSNEYWYSIIPSIKFSDPSLPSEDMIIFKDATNTNTPIISKNNQIEVYKDATSDFRYVLGSDNRYTIYALRFKTGDKHFFSAWRYTLEPNPYGDPRYPKGDMVLIKSVELYKNSNVTIDDIANESWWDNQQMVYTRILPNQGSYLFNRWGVAMYNSLFEKGKEAVYRSGPGGDDVLYIDEYSARVVDNLATRATNWVYIKRDDDTKVPPESGEWVKKLPTGNYLGGSIYRHFYNNLVKQ